MLAGFRMQRSIFQVGHYGTVTYSSSIINQLLNIFPLQCSSFDSGILSHGSVTRKREDGTATIYCIIYSILILLFEAK